MALTDFDEYVAKLSENRVADFLMSGTTARVQRANAIWQQTLPTPATPTTSVALDENSAQSMGPIPAISSGVLRMLGARISTGTFGAAGLIVVDLLNVNGGLSGIVTTAQTTNLPTAALTRYTTGEGVMAGIVIYTTLGTTSTTISINYTNQAGTSGRISTVTSFGGTSFREGNILIIIPLQEGDTGIRSIESVTVTATTGTAGNFGVCLFKPLAMISLESASSTMPLDAVSTGGIIGSLCEINADACLTFVAISATTTGQSVAAELILAEV